MKTRTIKTPTAELLILETPFNATNIIFYEGNNSLTWETENHIIKGYDLEGYTLLGKPDEIKEEDAMALVESFGRGKLKRFKGYNKNQFEKTAKESLLSLIETEIYWVNPIELEKWENDFGMSGNIITDEWKEAEQKTFDRNKTIIFKKNK